MRQAKRVNYSFNGNPVCSKCGRADYAERDCRIQRVSAGMGKNMVINTLVTCAYCIRKVIDESIKNGVNDDNW